VVIIVLYGKGAHGNVNYRGRVEWLFTRPCATGGAEVGNRGLHGITWEPCLSMLPSVCICV